MRFSMNIKFYIKFLFLTCIVISCNSTPEQDVMNSLNNEISDLKNATIFIVAEFDCYECVGKIESVVHDFQNNKQDTFYGLYYKTSNKTSKLESSLYETNSIIWKNVNSVKLFNDINTLTGSTNGPYVIEVRNGKLEYASAL